MVCVMYGEEAQATRKRCKLTQGELADLWQKSRAQITRYEKAGEEVPALVASAYRGLLEIYAPIGSLVDNAVDIFDDVKKSQLKTYFIEKGWRKPLEVAAFFDLPTISDLAKQTRLPPGERDRKLLSLMATLPFREDVLIGDELENQLAIIEAHRGKVPTQETASAAERICRHYTETFVPDEAYRYFHLAQAFGFKFERRFARKAGAMKALLNEKTLRDIENQVEDIPRHINLPRA